jgi:nicotinamide-nucleotide amidase
MRCEVVAVGTELLLGQIADTNARWMSEQLATSGVDVTNHQAVGDNLDRIVEALRLAASRADFVLVCGGLGPTEDDITRDAIAAFAGVPLVFHAELETMLREKFRRWSAIGPMPESNLRQASVPEGARWIVPDRGTAPGLALRLDGTRLYAVPCVPDEMREMIGGTVLPELRELAGGDVIVSRILRVAGMGESAVAERLADLFASSTNRRSRTWRRWER